jgi:cytochrome c-type biogenesis protein CcmH
MIAELQKMIDEGKSDNVILASFVAKYGKPVLSAPTAQGFDLIAWLMPFIAFLFGVSTVTYLAKTWRARAPRPETGSSADTAEYRDRLEKELKKYTPED